MVRAADTKHAGPRPLVLITGAAGNLGRSIGEALADGYDVVGFDRDEDREASIFAADLTSAESVEHAMRALREEHGSRLASVIHLAAYFDFSGEPNPLYESVNVEGTRRLLAALRRMTVE
jgi:nucleoside-diphosphate-sugar epimerase